MFWLYPDPVSSSQAKRHAGAHTHKRTAKWRSTGAHAHMRKQNGGQQIGSNECWNSAWLSRSKISCFRISYLPACWQVFFGTAVWAGDFRFSPKPHFCRRWRLQQSRRPHVAVLLVPTDEKTNRRGVWVSGSARFQSLWLVIPEALPDTCRGSRSAGQDLRLIG